MVQGMGEAWAGEIFYQWEQEMVGPGVERPAAVLKARIRSVLGMLEGLTLGFGGFKVFSIFFPTSGCVL